MINREKKIQSFVNGLSKEELETFSEQDYSILIDIIRLRIELLKEETNYDNESEVITSKITEMVLNGMIEFLENKEIK